MFVSTRPRRCSHTDPMGTTEQIWEMDNPPSKQWPLYTRGNVGEVFPEVVLNFTWDLFGQAAEDGWRDAYVRFGLIAPGDFSPDEPMVILSVFGGYCYINASYVRLVGGSCSWWNGGGNRPPVLWRV